MSSGWIDVHTHLNFLKNLTPEEGIQQSLQAGVSNLITIGTEPADHDIVLGLAKKHFPIVACTLGVHPHEGKVYTEEIDAYLRKNAKEPEVVAIGEIGLDYHYNNSSHESQRDAFRRQLSIARDLKMPIEIHTRDADQDTVEILREFKGDVVGIIHCFTGTQWLADQALDLGYDISISGVVTFKNAADIREVVKTIPLDRLHVETDAPFLAPLPHRGQPNVPAFVVHTAKLVAELKGVSLEALQESTRANARRRFPKLRLEADRS